MSSILYIKYDELIGLKNRVILDLKFKIKYPLHIGERQEGITKKMLQFNIEGKCIPIIPAESFKGAMRHLATKIAKEIFSTEDIHSDIKEIIERHNKDQHLKNADKEYVRKKYEEGKEWLLQNGIISKDKMNELPQKEIAELYLSFKCPICRLFGSRVVASKIIFKDVIFNIPPEMHRYTSTSIDRKTKTVAKERLFQIEYIPPEEKYTLSTQLIIDNVEPKTHEAKLLAETLKYIQTLGLEVGGSKSRGYGLLTLGEGSKVIILKLNPKPTKDTETVQNIKALLLQEEAIQTLNIKDYYRYLTNNFIR